MIGAQLGKYRIIGEIGSGGMATVYLGHDEVLDRHVAVKVLHPHLMSDTEALQRFGREATTAANLNHPNIVEIYDYSGDEGDNRAFIVMEYIEGKSLAQFLARSSIRFSELGAAVGLQIALALKHAHAAEVVHRDLKPDNIMIRLSDGRIKLTDFGIARLLAGQNLTITATVLGSPAYMSPEIIEGSEVGTKSDIFSLGILLYEMVTGQLPFAGPNPHALLKAIYDGTYRNPEEFNPVIAPEYFDVVKGCLRRNPEERYSIDDVIDGLNAVCTSYGITRPAETASAFMLNPFEVQDAYCPTLVRILEQRAQQAADEDRVRDAITHSNRLFNLDPGNETAQKLASDLVGMATEPEDEDEDDSPAADAAESTNGSSKARRVMLFLAAVVVLAVALAFGAGLIHNPPPVKDDAAQLPLPDDGPIMSVDTSSNGTPKQEGTVIVKKTEPVIKKPEVKPRVQKRLPRPADLKKRVRNGIAKKETPAPMGEIKVFTVPWATVYIDDKKRGTTPLDRSFKIPFGEHLVRMENPGCEPETRIVTLSSETPQAVVRQRLSILPAFLRITNNQGAKVYVDGVFKGTTPLPKPIKITWSEAAFVREVSVEMKAPGFAPKVATVKVRAGKVREFPTELTPMQ